MNEEAITKLTSAVEKLTSAVESHTIQMMESAAAASKNHGGDAEHFKTKWTSEETQRLVEMHDSKLTCAQMAPRFPGRTAMGVYHKLRNLGRLPYGPAPR